MASSAKRRRRSATEASPVTQSKLPVLDILPVPERFSLAQSVCSYGYFGLCPNVWVPAAENRPEDEGIYERPLLFGTPHAEENIAVVRLRQVAVGLEVAVVGGNPPSTVDDRRQILRQVRRIVRLDWSPKEFWMLHTEAAQRGYGRTFRSPTLWEDMVKTLTNCNMTWSGTVRMNMLLCSELGLSQHGISAFPTPKQVADAAENLRERCKVGYRAGWIVELAKGFLSGDVDQEWFEDSAHPDETIRTALMALKGFGPFASFNVMQLLGRHQSFPFDTETVRLFVEDFGVSKRMKSREVHALARARYHKYAPFEFLAYWFDLWKNYERRNGKPSSRWQVGECAAL